MATAHAIGHLRPGTAGRRPALATPPRHGDLALSGGHRHRGVTGDAATRAAAVADLAEERDVAQAEVAGDVDFLGRLEGVRRESVDLTGIDGGVVERELDRLEREPLLG